MNLIDYLKQHLLDEAHVLAACGIDASRLAHLQAARMAPAPAYRLRAALACDSIFGHHEEEHALSFYGNGMPAWIGAVDRMADETQAFALFAARYLARLATLPLRAQADKFNAGLDSHLRTEWQHFLVGTYGLCARSGLPEDIAAKEAASARIEELLALGDPPRAELTQAVDLLDRSCSLFAPHERARASRHRLVEKVRLCYQIPAPN